MKSKLPIVVAICVIILAGIAIKLHHPSDYQTLHFTEPATFGSTTLMLAIADTPQAQETGLSNQKSLAPNDGLLFTFAKPDYYGFWMKEMQFPLDIIWLDSSYKVVFIQKDFLPSTYPMVAYPSMPASFVLEVPADFTTAHQIDDGATLNLLH